MVPLMLTNLVIPTEAEALLHYGGDPAYNSKLVQPSGLKMIFCSCGQKVQHSLAFLVGVGVGSIWRDVFRLPMM